MVGYYFYAELSGVLSRTVAKWGDRGKLTIPDVVGVPTFAVVLTLAPVLALILFAIDRFAPGR